MCEEQLKKSKILKKILFFYKIHVKTKKSFEKSQFLYIIGLYM